MSFFINNTNQSRPGPICNNPVNGLNEKVLIEVTRVFDACMRNEQLQGITIQTTNYNPANPALPLTYISTETDQTIGPVTSNVVITRLENRPNFANVTGQITFPLIVTYRDANGVFGTATSENTFTITACVQIIVKVVADVDILVPSYGYPCIPECQVLPNVCPGVGDISLYPTTVQPQNLQR